jgi:Domain of unknown function (DUF3127)
MSTITGSFYKADAIVIRQANGREYRSRVFYLETSSNPQYPNNPAFVLKDDRCTLIDNIKPGEEIDVNFGFNGRFYNNPQGEQKHFNEAVVYSIAKVKREFVNGSGAPQAATAPSGDAPIIPTSNGADKMSDDIF